MILHYIGVGIVKHFLVILKQKNNIVAADAFYIKYIQRQIQIYDEQFLVFVFRYTSNKFLPFFLAIFIYLFCQLIDKLFQNYKTYNTKKNKAQ